MNKTTVLDEIRQVLISTINDMTVESIPKHVPQLKAYLSFLAALHELPTTTQSETVTPVQPSPDESPITTKTLTSAQRGNLFSRELRGGVLTGVGIIVPESMIRKLGIRHGDRVIATPAGYIDGHTRYEYELVEKGSGTDAPGRIEWNGCKVELDSSRYVVRSSYIGEEITNMTPNTGQTLQIREEDVRDFDLVSGDIIDVAYFQEKPYSVRVIWKHFIDAPIKPTKQEPAQAELKKTSEPKVDREESSKSNEFPKRPPELPLLIGESVLVVGCEPRKSVYKKCIEDQGGTFLWAEGIEGKTRLAAKVRQSTKVVILQRFIRHQASYQIVELCKAMNVPFSVIDSLGLQAVVQGAIDAQHDPETSHAISE